MEIKSRIIPAKPRNKELYFLKGTGGTVISGSSGTSSYSPPTYWELITVDTEGNPLAEPYLKTEYTAVSEKGISALKEFCLLRATSIRGQLDGEIGLTSDTQTRETLIDADELTISDMGSMEMNGFMGGKMERPMKNMEHSADMPPDRPMGNREGTFR